MFCPNCGLTINGHASKCPRCLTKIPGGNQDIGAQNSRQAASNTGSGGTQNAGYYQSAPPPPPPPPAQPQNYGGQYQQNTGNYGGQRQQVPQTTPPLATAALVCGILGLTGGFIPEINYFTGILAILAIIFGAIERKKALQAGRPAGIATAGMVLGIIAVVLTVILIIAIAAFAGALLYGLFSLL
jgi:hypothetical protein